VGGSTAARRHRDRGLPASEVTRSGTGYTSVPLAGARRPGDGPARPLRHGASCSVPGAARGRAGNI